MRLLLAFLLAGGAALAQTPGACSCGANPPGPPSTRTMEPYANEPEDMRPYTHFTQPYYEFYTKTVEFNGPGRDVPAPDLKDITEVPIAFLGPIQQHRDEALGRMMLDGATLAVEEANAAGGYCGKPFKLLLHNDSAIWGASSNEIVKMTYDEKVWAMLGSISGDTTHIALRVSLKSELPIVNTAATDPTIPETIIPWILTAIQDDRVQSYTLARRIYTELGLSRVALLRVNERYGRFGILKFKDASRRLGHPLVLEQKFMPGDTDFHRQLRVIQDSNVDAIVLWADQAPAGNILKQMHEMGMKQRVFGAFRVYGDEMLRIAGPAAEGLEFVFPYDPARDDPVWLDFQARFAKRFTKSPEVFASLGYDGMRIMLQSICRAGLNRARIRDVFYGLERYRGVTGEMIFDPNAKNIASLYLGTIHNGKAEFRREPMEKAYASIRDEHVGYSGPPLADLPAGELRIGIFGPQADKLAADPVLQHAAGPHCRLVGVAADVPWGKASTGLVAMMEQAGLIGLISTDRNSSHLAEQLAVKMFVPLIALSADRSLTALNIPWIFRLPPDATVELAVRTLVQAARQAGPNRERVRAVLASGSRFDARGEPRTGSSRNN
ncbi:MAG TPA: ABC transporter substrate-binding protein [Bryobacteraceae bacterium]|nr:ABC transporter substrate-binding protein [Bryobacteraceae bacterium]